MPANQESYSRILQQQRQRWHRQLVRTLLLLGIILVCFVGVGLFDIERMAAGVPAIGNLLGEMLPPDFSRFPQWIGPIGDTLAMSVAGTAIAIALSLPLCLLAARTPRPIPCCFRSRARF